MSAAGHTSVAGPALDALERSPLGPVPHGASDTTEWVWRELALVWADFERRVGATPMAHRIRDGTITVEQYRGLLLNLRREVVGRGCWIARAASSMSIDFLPVHTLLVRRAAKEQMNLRLLEHDYASVGGIQLILRARQ